MKRYVTAFGEHGGGELLAFRFSAQRPHQSIADACQARRSATDFANCACQAVRSAGDGRQERDGAGMSNDGSFGRELLDMGRGFAADLKRDIIDRHANENYAAGFDEAAHVCMSVLSDVIDGMMTRIKAGEFLSPQEQAALAQANELMKEMDKRLREAAEPEPTREVVP
ncbi:hypothetical protein ACFT5C_17765 [Streptomyces sp. NPDC057116]|uniref:hypothetical protein n=1 Tax=Streptomyces sp. NPDC057116 TaxID=3346023 RepID=UPI003638E73F